MLSVTGRLLANLPRLLPLSHGNNNWDPAQLTQHEYARWRVCCLAWRIRTPRLRAPAFFVSMAIVASMSRTATAAPMPSSKPHSR